VWYLETCGYLRIFHGNYSQVYGVAVSPDGQRVVSASRDNTLKVWDVETGRELRTLQDHSAWVNGVAVSPDGRRVVSASSDNTLKVWDLEFSPAVATFTCDAYAHCCAFADAHSIVAGDSAGRLHFLELMEKS
jgi:WD40 repeat protein